MPLISRTRMKSRRFYARLVDHKLHSLPERSVASYFHFLNVEIKLKSFKFHLLHFSHQEINRTEMIESTEEKKKNQQIIKHFEQ